MTAFKMRTFYALGLLRISIISEQAPEHAMSGLALLCRFHDIRLRGIISDDKVDVGNGLLFWLKHEKVFDICFDGLGKLAWRKRR